MRFLRLSLRLDHLSPPPCTSLLVSAAVLPVVPFTTYPIVLIIVLTYFLAHPRVLSLLGLLGMGRRRANMLTKPV